MTGVGNPTQAQGILAYDKEGKAIQKRGIKVTLKPTDTSSFQ